MIDEETAEAVARLYEVALDRDGAIDRPGLNFWIDVVEADIAAGATALEAISTAAESFIASPEFAASFGEPESFTDRAFVSRVYEVLFGRDGDTQGVDFWTSVLEGGGFDRADLLAAFATSAEGIAATPTIAWLREVSPGEWWIEDGPGGDDLPAGPFTAAVIGGEGGSFESDLASGADVDWLELVLEGGTEYRIRVTGEGDDPLADPAMAFYEADVAPGDLPFAIDDDTNRLDPSLFLRVAETQSIFLEVVSEGGGGGSYRVDATAFPFTSPDPRATTATQYHVRPDEDGLWRLSDDFGPGTLPEDDAGDWYSMALEAGDSVTLSISDADGGPFADARLTLRDEDGDVVRAAAPDANSLEVSVRDVGTYYAAIEPEEIGLAYDLEVLIA
jgi:hypothetical protein